MRELVVFVSILLLLAAATWGLFGSPDTNVSHGADDAITASQSDETARSTATIGARGKLQEAAPEARLATTDVPELLARLTQAGAPLPGIEVELRADRAKPRAIRTDARGRLRITGLVSGRYDLVPKGETIPHGWRRRHVHIKKGRTLDLGDVRVPGSGSIRGRVVDEAGRAVADVLVFLGYQMGYSVARFRRDVALNDPAIDPFVRTNVRGEFEFVRVSPGVNFILIENAVHADCKVAVHLSEGSTHDCGDLVLKEGRTLRGRVIEKNGKPVVAASIVPGERFQEAKRRKAARTDDNGHFSLHGLGPEDRSVEVRCDGFETLSVAIELEKQPVLWTLERGVALEGRVIGAEGAETTIRIDSEGHVPPTSTFRVLMRDLAVDADGSFRVRGLSAGRYSIVATAANVGTSAKVVFSIGPGMRPLIVPIREFSSVEVSVRDDVGNPVVGARVGRDPGIVEYPSLYEPADPQLPSRILGSRRSTKIGFVVTNAEGRATLAYPRDQPLALAADCDGYLPAARVFAPATVPNQLAVTLQRAARIAGTVDDASGRQRFSMTVHWKRLDPPSGQKKAPIGSGGSIDARGAFEIVAIPPGSYEVGIHYFDATWQRDSDQQLARITPLLGNGLDRRTVVRVRLAAGETKQLELRVAKLGRVHGRVLRRGAPIAGIAVFAVPAGQKTFDENSDNLDEPDGYRFVPHTTSAADGKYEFAFAKPGLWDLRVRHLDGGAASSPVTVRLGDPAQSIARDLTLGSATIRGRVVAEQIPRGARKLYQAVLFRTDAASVDPFFHGHHSLPATARCPKSTIDAGGNFEFDHLPAGDWVVRIGQRGSFVQRRVHTKPGQIVDLGLLEPPKTTQVALHCRVPAVATEKPKADPLFYDDGASSGWGVWVRKRLDGRQTGMFVTTAVLDQGRATVQLAPGTYEVELFRRYSSFRMFGVWGHTTNESRTLVVAADGSTKPEVLRY